MIFGVDEDCVVRAGSHAGFASDADRFIEINNAVRALEHRGGRTRGDARCVRALITTRHLVRAARLRKDANIDMLNVGSRHRQWYQIFRLARRGAGMAANATGVVNNLGPLHLAVLWFFEHERSSRDFVESELYHAEAEEK